MKKPQKSLIVGVLLTSPVGLAFANNNADQEALKYNLSNAAEMTQSTESKYGEQLISADSHSQIETVVASQNGVNTLNNNDFINITSTTNEQLVTNVITNENTENNQKVDKNIQQVVESVYLPQTGQELNESSTQIVETPSFDNNIEQIDEVINEIVEQPTDIVEVPSADNEIEQIDEVINEVAEQPTDIVEVPSTDNESTTTSDSVKIYTIVDTNQLNCYNNEEKIDCPEEGEAFYGQDAQYQGTAPNYTDNGDSTITDENTGLTWAQDQSSETLAWEQASAYCSALTTGDYEWRMPSVKELWSIRDFSTGWPWIDTDYFNLSSDGTTMSQHHSWTSEPYLVESDYQNDQVIGDPYWIVNDWTGHIKAMSGNRYVRCVTGDEYGLNEFVDNGDGTVSDLATGLMWSQDDNGETLYWEDALAYAENAETAGYSDWRLPSIKELQSIVDYSVEEIPAMDQSYFNLTETTNIVYDTETGEQTDEQLNYPFYWSSTSNSIESYAGLVDSDVDSDMIGTYYAWFLSSGYNTDPTGYDLHGAGSIVFGAKDEENETESGVHIMVRLVRNIE